MSFFFMKNHKPLTQAVINSVNLKEAQNLLNLLLWTIFISIRILHFFTIFGH